MLDSHDLCHITTVHYTQQRFPYIYCPQHIAVHHVNIATHTGPGLTQHPKKRWRFIVYQKNHSSSNLWKLANISQMCFSLNKLNYRIHKNPKRNYFGSLKPIRRHSWRKFPSHPWVWESIILGCAIPFVHLNYMVRWIQSKNTTIKHGSIMVFISKEKLHDSAYSGHLQVLIIFC